MKVSLYIPCYNSGEHIARCIEGVLGQTRPADEVLVIDDGSSDGTVAIASRYPVKVVRHKENLGLASARNTGIMQARNDLVASLDSDCVPEPGWLEKLARNFTDEKTAGAGGRLVEQNVSSTPDRWRSVHMKQHWGPERIVNPAILFGSNTVFRKHVLEEAGLYKREYRTNYEDADISRRIMEKGYALVYDPAAVAYHLRHDDLHSLLETHWRWDFAGIGGRRRPQSFYNLCCKFYDNLIYSLCRIRQDILAGRASLVYIDILIIFHHPWRDLRYYMGRR